MDQLLLGSKKDNRSVSTICGVVKVKRYAFAARATPLSSNCARHWVLPRPTTSVFDVLPCSARMLVRLKCALNFEDPHSEDYRCVIDSFSVDDSLLGRFAGNKEELRISIIGMDNRSANSLATRHIIWRLRGYRTCLSELPFASTAVFPMV